MRDNVYSMEHSYKDGGFWVQGFRVI